MCLLNARLIVPVEELARFLGGTTLQHHRQIEQAIFQAIDEVVNGHWDASHVAHPPENFDAFVNVRLCLKHILIAFYPTNKR